MVKNTLKFIFILLITANQCLAAIKVEVDRKELAINESLVLTITIDKLITKLPNFKELLQPDFSVVNVSTSKQLKIINGVKSNSTLLNLILLPQTTGKLRIPAMAIDNEVSPSIQINVTKETATDFSQEESPDIFLKTEVDKPSPYIQEQIIFTIRLFRSKNLIDAQLTPPTLQDAILEPLGNQKSYESKIKGVNYLVSEYKYAIFPQKSGNLTIPSIRFEGYLAKETSEDFLFPIFPQRGDYKILASPPIHVAVKPMPKISSRSIVWLPANSLRLSENWQHLANDIHVGDSITRTITTTAEGLLAAQLPEGNLPNFKSAKVYADKPTSQQIVTENGLMSQKDENIVIIPQEPGQLIIPEYSIQWWNTKKNTWEKSVLPQKILTILPAMTSTTVPSQSPEASAKENEQKIPEKIFKPDNNHYLIWLLSIISVALGILCIFLWQRNKNSEQSRSASDINDSSTINTHQIFQELITACINNAAEKVYQLLPIWAASKWPALGIHSFHDFKTIIQEKNHFAELLQELNSLEAYLFKSQLENAWSGQLLQQYLKTLSLEDRPHKKSGSFSALYPK